MRSHSLLLAITSQSPVHQDTEKLNFQLVGIDLIELISCYCPSEQLVEATVTSLFGMVLSTLMGISPGPINGDRVRPGI